MLHLANIHFQACFEATVYFWYFSLHPGLGIGIGYIMNAIKWDDTSLGKALGGQFHVVFLFNGTLCVFAMMVTLCSIKETPLKDLKTKKYLVEVAPGTNSARTTYHAEADGLYDEGRKEEAYGTFMQKSTQMPDGGRRRSHSGSVRSQASQGSRNRSFSGGSGHEGGGTDLEWDNSFDDRHFYDDELLTISKPDKALHSHIQFDENDEEGLTEPLLLPSSDSNNKRPVTRLRRSKSTASLKIEERERPASALQLLYSIVKMPKELRRLCLNHYLSWVAILPMYLFFTDYVGQAVYHGK